MITLLLLHPLKQTPVQVWPFSDQTVIRIGRSTDNDVVLYSAVVSRHHVELCCTNGQWEVINLGTNGTYIEGKRISKMPVTDGAIIRLARSGPNVQVRLGTDVLSTLPKSVLSSRVPLATAKSAPTNLPDSGPEGLSQSSAEAAAQSDRGNIGQSLHLRPRPKRPHLSPPPIAAVSPAPGHRRNAAD